MRSPRVCGGARQMSATLLLQSAVSGILIGGIYGLLAMGLSLSWGLLRLVNLSHFALTFLGAYLTYQLGTAYGIPAWISGLIIVPLFFGFGILLHAVFVYFKVKEFASLLVTFGITMLIESLIQWIWSADYLRYETPYSQSTLKLGPVYLPVLDLMAFLTAVALAVAAWLTLNRTMLGKALRAAAQDAPVASAFGVNSAHVSFVLAGLCSASAGIAGVFIALIATLAPSQIETWIGVVFAVAIIGGLANPLGALAAGILVGLAESLTMAVINPAWAPLVAFTILIVMLLRRKAI